MKNIKKNQNVLIIGAGKIGSIRAKTANKLFPDSKIYIYDLNFNLAQKLASEVNGTAIKDLESALKDKSINITVIAVINKFSKKYCIQSIKNNKHVLCEKPMGISYQEALAIAQFANKYNSIFKCGFNHRYHPGIFNAHKLCLKNKIGEILYIRAVYGHGGREEYDKEWRAKKQLSGGGELLDQGSHLIDLCLWFFGFETVKKTYCIPKTMFWKMDVDDNAFALIETKSGKVAQIHASWTQWKNLFRFEIYGKKGTIEINGLGKSYGTETLKLLVRHKLGKAPKIYEQLYNGYDNSWELEWKDFINSIKLNKLPMSNQNESLMVMKTISKLYNQ